MNQKTTIVLVIALLLAVGGVWWVQRKDNAEKPAKKSNEPKVLFEKPPDEAVGFETVKGGAALVFEKVDGNWRMKAPIRGSAQSSTVTSDVDRIRNLKFVKSFAKNDPDRPSDKASSLDNPVRVVKLTDKDGKSTVVKIGAQQALSNRTYIQKDGDDTIYLVEGDLGRDFNRRLSDYRGTRVIECSATDIARIESSGTATYTLVKSDNNWTVENPIKGRADQSKASTLGSTLSSLSAQNYVEDNPKSLRAYGLDSPVQSVAITIEKKTPKPPPPPPASMPATPEFDVKTTVVKLLLGGTAEEKVFAKLDDPDSPAVFQVAKSTLTSLTPSLTDVRDKRMTAASTAKAQKIVVTRAGGRVELIKNAGRWEIAPAQAGAAAQPAEAAAVDDLLKAIRDLNAIGFEDSDSGSFGLDNPRGAIELVVEGKTTPTKLTIGGLTPSKTGAYVRNDEENFVGVVSAESVEPLLVEPQSFLGRGLLEFARDRAARIDLTRAGETRTVENRGGMWSLTQPIQAAADNAVVSNILSDLSNLRGKKVVAMASDADKYGLAETAALKVAVTVNPPPKPPPTSAAASQPTSEPATPPTVYTVLVGRPPQGGTFAMVAGGQTICEIDAKVLDDLDAELMDTKVVTLQPTSAKMLTIERPTGTLSFEKSGEQWDLVGEASFQSEPNKINDVLNAVRDLKAKRYVRYAGANASEFGLDAPALTIKIATESEGEITLFVSSRGPSDADRYASASPTRDRVFVITKADADKFDKQAKDFQKGSTPAATDSVGAAPPMGRPPMGASPMGGPPKGAPPIRKPPHR